MWVYVLLGMLIGLLTEIVAFYLKLWVYRHKAFQLSNITLVFGLLAGMLTYHASEHGSLLHAVAAMGVFGLLYELTNLHISHLWHFTATTIPWLKGYPAVLATASAWAAVPVVIFTTHVIFTTYKLGGLHKLRSS